MVATKGKKPGIENAANARGCAAATGELLEEDTANYAANLPIDAAND